MKTVELKINYADLASRAEAAKLRRSIEGYLATSTNVRVDFSSVESLSDSYADELFGVLAANIGLAALTEKVKLSGASDNVYLVVAMNINNRLNATIAA